MMASLSPLTKKGGRLLLSSAYKSKLTHFQGIQSVSILDARPHENKQLFSILDIFGVVAKRKQIKGKNFLE